MKKTRITAPRSDDDDMAPEYALDFSKARRNPFAGRIDDSRVVVLLDADVSKVFSTPEAVNVALRALISAMSVAKKRSRVSR